MEAYESPSPKYLRMIDAMKRKMKELKVKQKTTTPASKEGKTEAFLSVNLLLAQGHRLAYMYKYSHFTSYLLANI
jgi:hypothetical protein